MSGRAAALLAYRAKVVNETLEWVGEWLAADTPLSTEEIARCVATGRSALLGDD